MTAYLDRIRLLLFGDTNLGRFIRFLAIGGLNTVVGYILFAALVTLSMPAQPALALSFSLAVLWNFWTHGRFVFRQNKLSKIPAYVACYIGIYLFNSAGLAFGLAQGFQPLVVQAIIAPIAAVLSFFLISRVLTGKFAGK